MKKFLPIFFITIVVVGGASFYGGMQYEKRTREVTRNRFRDMAPGDRQMRPDGEGVGGRGGRGAGALRGAGLLGGEIIAKDEKSVTVKLRDGGTRIVVLSGATTITKSAAGNAEDLTIGANVSVQGSANQDGSLTAETIQIR